MYKFSLLGLFVAVLLCLSGCDTPKERQDKTLTLLDNVTNAADLGKLAVAETEKIKAFLIAEEKKKANGEHAASYFEGLELFGPGIIALSLDEEVVKSQGWDDWSREATINQWKRIRENATPAELATLTAQLNVYRAQFSAFSDAYIVKDKPKDELISRLKGKAK